MRKSRLTTEQIIGFISQLREFESNLVALYRGIYEESILRYSFVNNDSPQYAMRVLHGHHDGYLVAGGYNPDGAFPAIEGEDTGTHYA